MSVYGGDSWGREAQNRKRRVDDLLIEGFDDDDSSSSSSSSSYKKLSNGKFSCLICPNYPVLDSPLMISMHQKGSRHLAAKSKLKARENRRGDDLSNNILLPGGYPAKSSTSDQKYCSNSRPLIEKAHRAYSQIVCKKSLHQKPATEISALKLKEYHHPAACNPDQVLKERKIVAQHQSDFLERREKVLKFTAAGWKRDCHGKWFKDEDVEFDSDSDEEDPNICFALG